MKKWLQNLEMQILAKKKTFYLPSSGAIFRYRKPRIWQCQLRKETVIVGTELRKVSTPEIPMVTSAIWKPVRDVGSSWNCKRKRNLMSNGGEARRQLVVKPQLHQMLLVSWLLTLFQHQWIHWKIFYSSKGLSLSRKCRILRTRRVLAHCCRRLYLKLPSMTKTFTNKTLDYF